jgi:hypothetical protein
VVTKPKAINLSTQNTEILKTPLKKNILLNIHQVRLLAQFSHVFVGKATVFSQNYFACQCIGCYKMSDTHSLFEVWL